MTAHSTTTQGKGLALTLISTIGIIVVVVALFVYTMTQPRVLSVKELVSNGAITYEKPVVIKPFALIDHNGAAFTPERLKGHWTLMFFGFSNCGDFCPTTLALLNQFAQQLKPDIADKTQVVMVSVDPHRDTPARLQEYMTTFNKDFIGVTGELSPIKALADQLYISFPMSHSMPNSMSHATGEGEHYDVTHGEQIVLINPEGDYHGFFKPPFTLARLKTTYQSIVVTYDHNH